MGDKLMIVKNDLGQYAVAVERKFLIWRRYDFLLGNYNALTEEFEPHIFTSKEEAAKKLAEYRDKIESDKKRKHWSRQ